MPFRGEHACRITDPGQYERIRRVNCHIEVDGKCIDVLYGIRDNESSEIQAYRYPTEDWTESAARSHCRDHDGTFEAAIDEDEEGASVKRRWFEIRAQADADEAEIEIFGDIGGSWFWGGVTVDEFKEAFDEVKDRSAIKVLINSGGGDVFDSMAIYNLLSGIRRKVTVEVIGFAASGASVVALAGKRLVMGEGAYLMVHNPWGFALGGAGEMDKMAELLRKISGQLADVYAAHSDLERDEVLEAMAEETWYTAQEAVDAGFADEVVDHDEEDEVVAAASISLQHCRNVPTHLLERAEALSPVPRASAAPRRLGAGQLISNIRRALARDRKPKAAARDCDCGREDTVTYAEILAAIGELTEQEREQLLGELGASERVASLEGRVEALEKANQQLSGELEAERQEKHARLKADSIHKALAEGRFPPADREFWERRFDADPKGTQEILDRLPKSVMFQEVGVGSGGAEQPMMSEAERRIHAAFQHSEEDVRRYGEGYIPGRNGGRE